MTGPDRAAVQRTDGPLFLLVEDELADLLEGQLSQFVDARISLPDDWQMQLLALVGAPTATQDDATPKRGRLERARKNLWRQDTWGDISDKQYRTEREAIERQLRDLEPRYDAPVAPPDIQRAGILISNLSSLPRHPGVSAKNQQEFIQEALERIEVDDLGICAVQFADALLPAVALTGEGEMEREKGFEPSTLCSGGTLVEPNLRARTDQISPKPGLGEWRYGAGGVPVILGENCSQTSGGTSGQSASRSTLCRVLIDLD